jgi:hypothetical protein
MGCFGCLGALFLGAVLTVSVWALFEATRPPDVGAIQTSPADGFRAQQKVFEIVRRARSGRSHTVELSEREVNAFLSRHLVESADLPVSGLSARLHPDGRAEVAGQIPWREILEVPPLSLVSRLVPAGWLEHKAWVSLLARVAVERAETARDRRYLRLEVDAFTSAACACRRSCFAFSSIRRCSAFCGHRCRTGSHRFAWTPAACSWRRHLDPEARNPSCILTYLRDLTHGK